MTHRRPEREQGEHKGGGTIQRLFGDVASRVCDVSRALSNRNVKERFLTLEKNNINGRGEFVITSSEERFQDKNRAIALRKLQEKVDRACAEPKKRKLKTGGNCPPSFP